MKSLTEFVINEENDRVDISLGGGLFSGKKVDELTDSMSYETCRTACKTYGELRSSYLGRQRGKGYTITTGAYVMALCSYNITFGLVGECDKDKQLIEIKEDFTGRRTSNPHYSSTNCILLTENSIYHVANGLLNRFNS
jgi:hypothetical protein